MEAAQLKPCASCSRPEAEDPYKICPRCRKKRKDVIIRNAQAGLCTRYGKTKAEPNRMDDRTRFRKNKVWKVAGLCTKCGKEAALPDRSLGPNCVEERRIRYQQNEKSKNKEKNQARYKAWREQSIALGLCTYCKDGKAEPGKRKCEDCNEIARTKKRIETANNQMRRRIERGEKIRKGRPPAALAEAMT